MPHNLWLELLAKATQIHMLPNVNKVILYGSYAKGLATKDSDVDLAVFFDEDKEFFLEEYRALVKLCSDEKRDYQVQAFSALELQEPCGIIEEIVRYGVEITPLRYAV
ncbi:MAG: nucleotidyltransferase domain-containing protein [Bacillota bacterium]|nr:nucleotidyltransferase domain-containing protein [Bacillota bacterium]